MAYPTVVSVNTSVEIDAGYKSAWSYTMPSGIQAGDILIHVISSKTIRWPDPDEHTDDSATSTTWTRIGGIDHWGDNATYANGADVWGKVANGDEDGKIISWTTRLGTYPTSNTAGTTTSQGNGFMVFRNTATRTLDDVEINANSAWTGGNAISSVTCPTVASSWGATPDTLAVAINAVMDINQRGAIPTTFPYASNQSATRDDTLISPGEQCSVALCTAEVNSASVSPGDFTDYENLIGAITPEGRGGTLLVKGAKIARDNFTIATSSVVSGGTTAHTVAAGSNRALLAFIIQEDSTAVSAVTYGTESLTKLDEIRHTDTPSSRIEIWWLNEAGLAAAANSNLIVTGPTSYPVIWSGSNIHQNPTVQDTGTAEAVSQGIVTSPTLTASPDSLLIAAGFTNTDETFQAVTDQALLGQSGAVGSISYALYEKPVDASGTISVDIVGTAAEEMIAAVSLNPYVALYEVLDPNRKRKRDPRIRM